MTIDLFVGASSPALWSSGNAPGVYSHEDLGSGMTIDLFVDASSLAWRSSENVPRVFSGTPGVRSPLDGMCTHSMRGCDADPHTRP